MRLKLFLFISVLFFLFPKNIHAENEFNISSTVTYDLSEKAVVHIKHNITLKNNLPSVYAKSYSLNLQNIDVQNVQAYDQSKSFDVEQKKVGENLELLINFPDIIVGKAISRSFTIAYDVSNLLTKTGEVWEITLPKLDKPETFNFYEIKLLVPITFGKEAYLFPKADNITVSTNQRIYTFNKETMTKSAVSAGFGEFQVFSYSLDYHLENPLGKTALTDIAIPPDTSYQRIFLDKIDPSPEDISVDIDGNWIATYKLAANARVDVRVTGTVQIFSKARNLGLPNNLSTAGSLYWEVNDTRIKNIAATLKNAREINDYVVNTLNYDVTRVAPNLLRLGALGALNNPARAICMEYTDLFIALARAKGIPAREINGYAYTENPEVQPLSFVADVLHAWPEYYDLKQNIWVPVDPTWQDTTGGENFFDKFDFRHFTFVIHGADSTIPYAPGSYKVGPNPQKDVYVTFGKLPDIREASINLSASLNKVILPINTTLNIKLYNSGPSATYNQELKIYYDGILQNSQNIAYLLPTTSKIISYGVKYKPFGLSAPNKITIILNNQSTDVVNVKTNMLINSLLVLMIIIFVILGTYYILIHDIFKKAPRI